VRRIGEVVREQLELYGTLTGSPPTPKPAEPAVPERAAKPEPDAAVADVLELPRRGSSR
jgi:hypothetical protein